ncbi:hypothetical protein NKG94_06825 [Micromonospora sp. M12]
MISSKARESKNFVAMMQFIDWLWYSDAGMEFARWGVEGTTFTKDASGKRSVTPRSTSSGSTRRQPSTCRRTSASTTASSPTAARPTWSAGSSLRRSWSSEGDGRPQAEGGPAAAPVDRRGTRAGVALGDPAEGLRHPEHAQVRPRPAALSEWDAYVAELKGKNSEQYIDLVNKAYERFQKNNG